MHFVLPLNLMRLERQQDRPPATVTVFSRSVAPVELSTRAFCNVFAGYFGAFAGYLGCFAGYAMLE